MPPLASGVAGTPNPVDFTGVPMGLEGGQQAPTNPDEAAKAFASVLFGYMFAEMRSKDEDGLFGSGDTEMFMDFFDQAMARSFVDQGNPLVDMLKERLKPKGEAHEGQGPS